VDPEPFTLRELLDMREGRARLEWEQTSAMMALFYNANKPKNAPRATPATFNPFTRRDCRRVGVDFLRDLLVRGRGTGGAGA
jgi:hypothetical protein